MLLLKVAFDEFLAIAITVIIMIIILVLTIRIVREHRHAVVFPLRRLTGAKGPGLIHLVPVVDRAAKVYLRIVIGVMD
jgi:regulator of protease activity HflC (stomatin/prohibitin superfamily)